MLKFPRIVFLDGIQPRGGHTGSLFVLISRVKRNRSAETKAGRVMDIAHVHN